MGGNGGFLSVAPNLLLGCCSALRRRVGFACLVWWGSNGSARRKCSGLPPPSHGPVPAGHVASIDTLSITRGAEAGGAAPSPSRRALYVGPVCSDRGQLGACSRLGGERASIHPLTSRTAGADWVVSGVGQSRWTDFTALPLLGFPFSFSVEW